MLVLLVAVHIVFGWVFMAIGRTTEALFVFLLSLLFFMYFQASFVIHRYAKDHPRKPLLSEEIRQKIHEQKPYYLGFFGIYVALFLLSDVINTTFDYAVFALHVIIFAFAVASYSMRDSFLLLMHRSNTVILFFLWILDALYFSSEGGVIVPDKFFITAAMLVVSFSFCAWFDFELSQKERGFFFVALLLITFFCTFIIGSFFLGRGTSMGIIGSLWGASVFFGVATSPRLGQWQEIVQGVGWMVLSGGFFSILFQVYFLQNIIFWSFPLVLFSFIYLYIYQYYTHIASIVVLCLGYIVCVFSYQNFLGDALIWFFLFCFVICFGIAVIFLRKKIWAEAGLISLLLVSGILSLHMIISGNVSLSSGAGLLLFFSFLFAFFSHAQKRLA